jgi:hypothetical protein
MLWLDGMMMIMESCLELCKACQVLGISGMLTIALHVDPRQPHATAASNSKNSSSSSSS